MGLIPWEYICWCKVSCLESSFVREKYLPPFDIWRPKYVVQNFRDPNPQNTLNFIESSIKFSTNWYILSIFVKSLKYLSNSLNHLSNYLSESTTWFSTKKYMMIWGFLKNPKNHWKTRKTRTVSPNGGGGKATGVIYFLKGWNVWFIAIFETPNFRFSQLETPAEIFLEVARP